MVLVACLVEEVVELGVAGAGVAGEEGHALLVRGSRAHGVCIAGLFELRSGGGSMEMEMEMRVIGRAGANMAVGMRRGRNIGNVKVGRTKYSI